MGSSTAWTNHVEAEGDNRASVIRLTLRLMACFVVAANHLAHIQAGPFSLLAYATILFLIVAVMELAFMARHTLLMFKPLLAWLIFAFWLCISFAVVGIPVPQVPIAYALLIASMALSGICAQADPSEVHRLLVILRWAFVANAILSMLFVALSLSDDLLGPRTCAITAVLGLAVVLSYWRHGHPRWFFVSVGILLVPLLTISRTALACGLLLFPISAIGLKDRKPRWTKIIILVIVACGIAYGAVEMFPEVASRFFYRGRTASDFIRGKATLDTSGRTAMWQAVIDSWSSTPQTMLIGQGAGSSHDAASEGVSAMGLAHNDYLAILHDFGIIGCSIFVVALVHLLWGRWKAWSHAEAVKSQYAVVHSAAFLIILVFALIMITDNPMVYVFAILPTALVVGSSLGVEIHERYATLPSRE